MGGDDRQLGATLARGFAGASKIRWPLVRASEIFELRYGKALVEGNRTSGSVPVYGTNGQCGTHDRHLFEGPGVVLGRKGQGPLGVEWVPGSYWVIDTAYSLAPTRNDIDIKFAYYLIKYVGLNHLKDGTSNPSLSRDTFGAQLFPLPPVDDQRAITTILGMLDDKIELNRQTNETLEATARALFKSWFVDFDPVRAKAEGRQPSGMDAETATLFPSEFEESELGEIPKEWAYKSLTEAAELNPTRVLKKDADAPYVEMANLPTRGHRPAQWPLRKVGSGARFRNGDTLLARITPCLENGKTGFVDFLDDGVVGWGSTEYIVIHPRPPLPPEWGYLVARDRTFRDFAAQKMEGTTGRQRVSADSVGRYTVAVPSADVANRFGLLVSPLFQRMASAHDENRVLVAIRDALLPRLLSGELTVSSAEHVFNQPHQGAAG